MSEHSSTQFPSEVHGPHNLAPEAGKHLSLIDKTAEAAYLALIQEWDSRAAGLHASPDQTPTPTHEGQGLHYAKISLYHGGKTASITDFLPAEDSTIGHGLYATSMPDQAFGYATVRADKRKKVGDTILVSGSSPVVYEVELEDVTFLDLRSPETTAKIMKHYANYLEKWLAMQQQRDDLSWLNRQYLDIVAEKLGAIRDSEGNLTPSLKEMLQQTGSIFAEFVTGLGYDGAIAYEGGEGGYTARHDSWVIMEPSKARVTKEVNFLTPHVLDDDAWQAQRAKMDELFGGR